MLFCQYWQRQKYQSLSRLDNIYISGKVGEKGETLKGSGFSLYDFGQWSEIVAKFFCKALWECWGGAAAAGRDEMGAAE